MTLKHLTLKNRVMSTSHEPAYSEEGLPKERYRLYHEEKAKGGIGLTMFGGGTLVARDSPAAYGNLYAGDDAIVPYFQKLAQGVHAHGAATMCQISHLGRRTSNYAGDWLPVIAPSAVREPAHRAFPKAMEDWDIRRTVRAYGAAAAHNRAMHEFTRQDSRMIGVAMVPLQDPNKALAEIEQAIELGLGAIWIAAEAPGGRSPGHPLHEPLWSTMAEAGLPFILHVGLSLIHISEPTRRRGMGGGGGGG